MNLWPLRCQRSVLLKKNLLGYTSNSINNSGLFGEELIAGGYLSKFSIFSIIFLQIFIAKDNFTKKILAGVLIFLFIFCLHFTLATNALSHVATWYNFLIFLFVKKLRPSIFFRVFLAFISILISMQSNGKLKSYHLSFYNNFKIVSHEVTKKVLIENFGSEEQKNEKIRTEVYWPVRTGHKQLFLTAIDVWKDSLFLKMALNSRIKCSEKQKKIRQQNV